MAIDRETQVLNAAVAAGITNPRELANFMAQTTHESLGLHRLEEGFRYTKGIDQIPVKSAWRHGAAELETARVEALQGKPEHLAELMYGGRGGNDHPGDAYNYRGRGYIQLTGKDNYQAAGTALGLDLVKHPELAAEPENAAKIAVWYWQKRVPEQAHGDVRAATHAINNGYNGLADREERFHTWEKKLTPEVMERLTHGEVGKPPAPASGAPEVAPHVGAPVSTNVHPSPDSTRHLQEQLAELGYTDTRGRPLPVNGHVDLATRHAVEAFQQQHGLKVDGIVGPMTTHALTQALQQQQAQRADAARSPAVSLHDPAHPGHALFQQGLTGVQQLNAQYGVAPDLVRDGNLSAALAVRAATHGMTRIDHVSLSEDARYAFAIQGHPQSPDATFVRVETMQATQTPLAQSSAQWPQAMQHAQPQPAQTSPGQVAGMSP